MRERLFSWLSFARLVQYGTSALIFDPEGRVLLVKHRLRGGWEWPAGGGKLGELPHQGVIREVQEEVSIELQNPRLVAVYARRQPWLATRINFTFGETVSAEAAARAEFERFELTDMRWVALEEAGRLISPRLRHRFELSLAAWQEGRVAYISR